MCSIAGSKGKINNKNIQLRGQDHTETFKKNGWTFIHNLLSVTGEFTIQPFVEDNIVCLYNGEIYNYCFKRSDGEVLIPLYKEYGINFPKHLDGEFAVVLFDFDRDIAIFATDPFKTKPLFINGLEFGSYRSAVGGEKANPNEIVVKRISTGEIIDKQPTYQWDFTQKKDTYDDWIGVFKKSVKKRAKDNCFIGLSSGYDSGAIVCEMLEQDIDFKTYTFVGCEDKEVLKKRIQYVDNQIFIPNVKMKEFLKENIDNEPFSIKYRNKITDMKVLDDGGTYGVATICDLANKEGRKVCLSSQGADEIMSDYSLMPEQSELKGLYPNELEPWWNFNYGCQESYLIKEEYAGGAFNVETRYPFLDKDLVQEFLWLKPELKNKHYKAPLREYLIKNNFPFKEGEKIGFSINI